MPADSDSRRILGSEGPSGDGEVALALGPWRIRISGLAASLASSLERRFGPFLSGAGAADTVRLRATRGSGDLWLPRWERGERYRIEGTLERGRPVIRSYHFAMTPEAGDRSWRLALDDSSDEPGERIVENAIRCVVARLAAAEGGFAIHAGGALRRGKAFVFAGPSRSGKTTILALSRGLAESLGDDLAVVLPGSGGWAAPALPFESHERPRRSAPEDLFPVAGIFRLFQDEATRVEEVPAVLGAASLVSCMAVPGAVQDLSDAILRNASRFVATGRFAHLHFAQAPDFWRLLDPLGDA